jgi:hypothetical protein
MTFDCQRKSMQIRRSPVQCVVATSHAVQTGNLWKLAPEVEAP